MSLFQVFKVCILKYLEICVQSATFLNALIQTLNLVYIPMFQFEVFWGLWLEYEIFDFVIQGLSLRHLGISVQGIKYLNSLRMCVPTVLSKFLEVCVQNMRSLHALRVWVSGFGFEVFKGQYLMVWCLWKHWQSVLRFECCIWWSGVRFLKFYESVIWWHFSECEVNL